MKIGLPAAFAFARLNFRGRDTLFFILLVGLMFPAQVTILPIYLGYAKVGLINQPIGLALMYLTSSFGVFLMRQFMLGVPDELLEASQDRIVALTIGVEHLCEIRQARLRQLGEGLLAQVAGFAPAVRELVQRAPAL